MNFELKREEEALASGETPPESHLLDAVRDLVEGEDNGGPIFECSWDDVASGELAESQLSRGESAKQA